MSVLTATYNAAAFIEATLASALAQTFEDFEIVVIDDGSVDDTRVVVERVMQSDPRIRLIRQDNRGPSATRNRGIGEARGALIAFLDHDDLWLPGKLALQVALLDEHPDVGVASCYSAVIDRDHRCLGWRLGGDATGDVYSGDARVGHGLGGQRRPDPAGCARARRNTWTSPFGIARTGICGSGLRDR